MRNLLVATLLALGLLGARAETLQQWLDAAPHADVVFTPWLSGSVVPVAPEIRPPSQNCCGHLDLSHLPADAFPIRVRLFYEAVAVENNFDPIAAGLGRGEPLPSPEITEETTFATPAVAAAIPVWGSPVRLERIFRAGPQDERVRLEVLDRAGKPLDRRVLVASPSSQGPAAGPTLTVGDPAASRAFSDMNLAGANVPRLVPDAFGCAGIAALWIDASVTADPALTDAFWRRVLLGGTVVLGLPENIQPLTARLGLGPSPRVLLGALVPCSSDQDLHEASALIRRPNDLANLGLFNQPSGMLAHGLSRELVDFSRAYLGIFLLLQVALLAVAFGRVRDARRVWLWLVIPFFALVYTILGILCSRVAVADRAEVRVNQIEQQREGWSEALLLSDLWDLDMSDAPASYRLPADSRQYSPANYQYFSPHEISYVSRQDADGFQLIAAPSAGWHSLAFIRSWIPARAPCSVSPDGRLTPQRDFSQAWLLDDGTWRDLGPLRAGQPVRPITFPPLPPGAGTDHDLFPARLRPMLEVSFTDALQAAGDSVFFGIESDVDATIDHASAYRVQSRRVVAYQFHLAQAAP